MIEVRQTKQFVDWLIGLRDTKARKIIRNRLNRIELGLFGDVTPVGQGISELRIDFGPGYRVYFVRRGAELVILLGGGDKASQPRDIAKAKELAGQL